MTDVTGVVVLVVVVEMATVVLVVATFGSELGERAKLP